MITASSNTGSWGAGFGMVPGWLLVQQPSANALLVYVHLAMFGTFNPGTATYEQCRPSAKTLANGDPKRDYPGTGLSINTVRRALTELEALGAIVGEPAYDSRGGQLPNVYRLQFGTLHQPGGLPTGGYQSITRYPDPDIQIQIPTSSPLPSPQPPAGTSGGVVEGGRRDEPEGNQPQDAHDGGGHLVSAAAIADALPPVGRSRVGVKLRATLVAGIAAKLADGWQPDDIADELTRDLDTARTTGVYAHRLADMPTNPPRRRTPTAPQSGLKPPKCEDEGCNDKRQRHNADGIPYRCPDCHPLAVRRPQSATEDRNPATVIPRQDAHLSTLLGAAAGSVGV